MSDHDTIRALLRYKTETAIRDLERKKELDHERQLSEIRTSGPPISPPETIAAQLERLRNECRWTIPKLAEFVGVDSRSVDRHLAGSVTPSHKSMSAYEHAFSKHLKRQIVLKQMPRRCR